MASVLDKVREIAADKLSVDIDDISGESSFTEDLDADSLDIVELIMAFEEEFSDTDVQVEITDEDAEKILTVGDAVEFLKNAGVKE